MSWLCLVSQTTIYLLITLTKMVSLSYDWESSIVVRSKVFEVKVTTSNEWEPLLVNLLLLHSPLFFRLYPDLQTHSFLRLWHRSFLLHEGSHWPVEWNMCTNKSGGRWQYHQRRSIQHVQLTSSRFGRARFGSAGRFLCWKMSTHTG